MNNCPTPKERVEAIRLAVRSVHITIEPIMQFDLFQFVHMIAKIAPTQVNIGADSKRHNLPEPSKKDILELISQLESFTTVIKKDNLKRLLL
jgi:hypothetical protein